MKSITAKIERDLVNNPRIRNCDLVARYGCSNALPSRIRKRLGMSLNPNKQNQFRVVLPAYMLEPLMQIASSMGDDVTIDDVVIGVIDDLIAEHQISEAAE